MCHFKVLEDEPSTPTPELQNQTSSQPFVDANLQAKITTLETSLSEAESKILELAMLKQELTIAQTKVKNLSAQILDQRCLEIDLAKLKSNEISLGEQNSKLEEDIKLLKEHFQSSVMQHCDVKNSNLVSKLLDAELKFKHVETKLLACQDKITSVLSESKSSPESLSSRLDTLKSVGSDIADVLCSPVETQLMDGEDSGSLSPEDQVRIYAERLALEALVLGELAYNVKVNESDVFAGQETILVEMELANHTLLNLEQTITTMDGEYCLGLGTQPSSVCSERYSLEVMSNVLSHKLQLQQKVSELIDKDRQCSLDSSLEYHPPQSTDPMLDELGQQALFRIFLDEKLLLSDSSHFSEFTPVSMFSTSVVQSDLTLIQSKLREHLQASVSQKQKETFVHSELNSRYQALKTNQKQCSQHSQNFVDLCTASLAKMCAVEVVQIANSCLESSGAIALKEVVQKVFDREQVQSEITLMVNKYVHNYSDISEQLSSKESAARGKTSLLIDCVQQETSELCVKLVNAIHQQLDSMCSQGDCTVLSESDQHEQLLRRNSLAMGLCSIVAQKTILSVQILHVEQLLNQQGDSPHKQDSEFKLPLKRNDSGVVVHSMSLPTSPTEQLHDQLVLSLQQEAQVKSDIASYLLNNTPGVASSQTSGKPRSYESGGLREQIARLASELVSMDRQVLKSSSRGYRCTDDYIDYLAREAVMQAQLSYSLNVLKIKHTREMESLKLELDSSQSLLKVKQEERIADLEDEIDRLSGLIKDQEDSADKPDWTNSAEVLALKQKQDTELRSLSEQLSRVKTELATVKQQKEKEDKERQSLRTQLKEFRAKIEVQYQYL